MTDTLVVRLGGEHVGELVRERQKMRFHPLAGASRLSIAEQAEGPRWPPAFTRAWFDGLLPEGDRRTAAEALHNIARGDTFGLLGEIGWECAGAVSVMPEGVDPGLATYEPLNELGIWSRLDALPRSVGGSDLDVRLSLGGAQDKILLARFDGEWNLPLEGAPSTHILKPEPIAYPGLAAAEAWSLHAAAAVTLTASAELLLAPDHRPTLVVERYDREIRPDSIVRSHQEDLCQVLGLPPEQKYVLPNSGELSRLRRLADILVARGVDAERELIRLLEQVVVNVALANTDAHAKNISVVHVAPSVVTLSPLYDVAPTLFFLPRQVHMGMPVGGNLRITEVTRGHLLAEALSWGVPRDLAVSTITEALERLDAGMKSADSVIDGISQELRALVTRQYNRLAFGQD